MATAPCVSIPANDLLQVCQGLLQLALRAGQGGQVWPSCTPGVQCHCGCIVYHPAAQPIWFQQAALEVQLLLARGDAAPQGASTVEVGVQVAPIDVHQAQIGPVQTAVQTGEAWEEVPKRVPWGDVTSEADVGPDEEGLQNVFPSMAEVVLDAGHGALPWELLDGWRAFFALGHPVEKGSQHSGVLVTSMTTVMHDAGQAVFLPWDLLAGWCAFFAHGEELPLPVATAAPDGGQDDTLPWELLAGWLSFFALGECPSVVKGLQAQRCDVVTFMAEVLLDTGQATALPWDLLAGWCAFFSPGYELPVRKGLQESGRGHVYG